MCKLYIRLVLVKVIINFASLEVHSYSIKSIKVAALKDCSKLLGQFHRLGA